MVKVGVIGVGYLGQHHARIYSELKGVELVGVADIDEKRVSEIAKKYSCRAYTNYYELLKEVEAVSIVVPTVHHYAVAIDAINENIDILVEKPITSTIDEAEILIREADKKNLILQVGHLERFNSALMELSKKVKNPIFIESQRISPFLGRGIDVDVVVDLMVHDIDLILSMVDSEVVSIKAKGIKVLTEHIDLAHAWIEFKNGCTAVAVANRLSSTKLRTLKIFQHNAYMELDFQKHEITDYVTKNGSIEKTLIKTEIKEPLKEELSSFIECVKNRRRPIVSGREGKEALELALKISEVVKSEDTNGGSKIPIQRY